ncbi:spore maturation protein CgeB [Sporomusaceae bacterium BoRhaA]|uniref:CgeB family protein n=1 Tax=Pelorhabdus rhamnosifermentans TaxID=2772457 RepID=UPI001C062D00|nr:glycosyltransferase [Pelorhabdus rhamnosifermentans]MBU2704020.1 spore maturation protein CgeB [Pelorhabdus rhamnosifermentans]
MKILLISPIPHDELFDLKSYLKDRGHDVRFVGTQDFEEQYSYFVKKMHKLGIVWFKENYYKEMNENIKKIYLDFNPDLVFLTNGAGLKTDLLRFMKKKTKIVTWLFDSVKRDFMIKTHKNFCYYDRVFVFESDDIPYIKKQFGIEAEYCPIGYNNKKYFPQEIPKDIDIIFVGNASEKRVNILRKAAEYVFNHHLTMRIYGNWYDEKHFWKKYQFKKHNPVLFKYIINNKIVPGKVADLYRRSRICLNIHAAVHSGINPRTFDILGTRSFELLDERENYNDLIRPNIDVAIYKNADDLINKIDYYLAHKNERLQISNNGYECVKDKLSIGNCLENIFSTISTI